jgi:LPXTG-motif cell wall-anchored protein
VCHDLAEPGEGWMPRLIEREVTSVRRAFVVLSTAALLVVVWAATAVAQTSDYPPTPGGGQVAVPVQAPAQAPAAGQLPRTGSSNTPSLVLIGIAAVVVGLVLVLAVRRRRAAVRGSI